MISKLRNSIFTKILTGIMGVYFLNISVDTEDPYPNHIPEDLSFNDQESIVEIVVEKLLGYEDAFKEYDDNDTEDHNKTKNVKIDFLVYDTKTNNKEHNQYLDNKKLHHNYEARLTTRNEEVDSPPPKI